MSTLSLSRIRTDRPWLVYLFFVALTVAVGSLIGTQFLPGTWYEGLDKPPFNPPNWIFGPVWTTLYIMIGLAGARIFLKAPHSNAMKVWWVQMVLNWIWSPIWFGAQQIWLAFVVIVAIWLGIVTFMALARRVDPLAARLFLPYLAWVSFATLLNLSIGILN